MNTTPSKALAKREQRLDMHAGDPAWQRTWLALESAGWRSLAVVPTGNLSSLDLVHGLASVAWQQRGSPVIVADLRSVALPALAQAREELRQRVNAGERVLIAIHSFDRSPTSAAIARDADKAVLCVHFGETLTAHVRNAISELGKQRYLGTIVIRDPSPRVNS